MIIFLLGYMACGKTTLGQAVAAAGYAEFLDLDEAIAKKSGLTAAEWFATRGEAAFRAAERATLEEICRAHRGDGKPLVVACGGGTPCQAGLMELMNESGLTVWLRASLDRTVARLLEADGKRPLVAGMDEGTLRAFIPGHLSERESWYGKSQMTFDSTYLDTREEVEATVALFKEQLKI